MREGVSLVRERRDAGLPRRSAVLDFINRHRPTWTIAAVAAILLGGVGAFETGDAAPWTLYPYWALLTFSGGALGAVALDRLDAGDEAKRRSPTALAGTALALSLTMTPLVYLLSGLVLNGGWELERLPHLWSQVLLIAPIFLALQIFMEGRLAPRASLPGGEPAAAPRFFSRLPVRLRHAQIHAIEAQDHYLRVYTDLGPTLILMSLSGAVSELGGIDGQRTHRSWWVARGAVVDAARGGGRGQLTLKGGLCAPVSRTYAPQLRRRGWF